MKDPIMGHDGRPRRLQFPKVDQTTLRPDVVLWSEEAKKVILIELSSVRRRVGPSI